MANDMHTVFSLTLIFQNQPNAPLTGWSMMGRVIRLRHQPVTLLLQRCVEGIFTLSFFTIHNIHIGKSITLTPSCQFENASFRRK